MFCQLSKFGNVDPTCPNYSPDGKLLGKWELAERMSATYGYPMIAIRWSTVLKTLQDLLPAECIHTGHCLIGMEEVGGGYGLYHQCFLKGLGKGERFEVLGSNYLAPQEIKR